VEFVYPKDSANERKPYVFDKQQKASTTSSTSRRDGHEEEATGNKKPKLTSESIDDILFRKGKEKQKHQAVDEARRKLSEEVTSNEQERKKRPAHQSIDARHADDTEGGKLSGLSVEDAVRDKVGCRPRANSTDGELNLPRRGLCDERMVLESHRWKNSSTGNHPPKGFLNLGNTCFLNATLQCLAYLPTFSQTLMSLPATARGTNGRKPTKGQRMTAMLSSLFRQVHGHTTEGRESHAISPHGIVRAVPTLGAGGSRSGYKFRPGQQEDSHEFLVHLLDAMQDGELKAAGTLNVCDAVHCWLDH
jgi:ubiquitin carboxyl-terminal hydrolase 36/42